MLNSLIIHTTIKRFNEIQQSSSSLPLSFLSLIVLHAHRNTFYTNQIIPSHSYRVFHSSFVVKDVFSLPLSFSLLQPVLRSCLLLLLSWLGRSQRLPTNPACLQSLYQYTRWSIYHHCSKQCLFNSILLWLFIRLLCSEENKKKHPPQQPEMNIHATWISFWFWNIITFCLHVFHSHFSLIVSLCCVLYWRFSGRTVEWMWGNHLWYDWALSRKMEVM